jgi:hypothetical protein
MTPPNNLRKAPPMAEVNDVVAELRAQFAAEPDAWLIRKGGYYYRPNCQGYTTVKAAAGRYSEAEAKAEASVGPDNMSAVRADDVPGAAFEISREQASALLDLLAQQAAREEALVKERDVARSEAEFMRNQSITNSRECNAAEAENARLREALDWIARFAAIRSKDDRMTAVKVHPGALRNIAERARAALSTAAEKEG